MIEAIELVVSELVTNAVRASAVADEPHDVVLTLRLLPDRVAIEVFDRNPNSPVLTDPDTEAESGRGLLLVEALSDEWGHRFPPSGGKTVFAVLALPDGVTR